VEEIISDYNDFNIKMVEILYERGYRFDAMWVFSDLAYKNGMLFSPDFFSQIILPYQKKFFDLCKSKGMKVIYHSDGNLSQLLPLLIEAGIDCIQPMEARAGNNVVEYTQLYGDRISFIGNINADILATDKEQIYA
jgi:uroporphyrinogen decarboxylase